MISNFGNSLVFNEVNYLTFCCLCILSLSIIFILFFFILFCSNTIYSSIYVNDVNLEISITFLCFIFILFVISPGLILFIDFDLFNDNNLILNINGYQWAWKYSLSSSLFISSSEQIILPSFSSFFSYYNLFYSYFSINLFDYYYSFSSSLFNLSFLFNFNSHSLYSFVDLFDYFISFDSHLLYSFISSSDSFDNLFSFNYITSINKNPGLYFNFSLLSCVFNNFLYLCGFASIINFNFNNFCTMLYFDSFYSFLSLFILVNFNLFYNCLSLFTFFNFSFIFPIYFKYFSFLNSLNLNQSNFFSLCFNYLNFPINIFSNFVQNNYMCLFNKYLIVSLNCFLKIYVNSIDVIHSYSFHNFGFKSDTMPGKVNTVSSSFILIFPLCFQGFCYELCGLSHTSMLSSIKSSFYILYFYVFNSIFLVSYFIFDRYNVCRILKLWFNALRWFFVFLCSVTYVPSLQLKYFHLLLFTTFTFVINYFIFNYSIHFYSSIIFHSLYFSIYFLFLFKFRSIIFIIFYILFLDQLFFVF